MKTVQTGLTPKDSIYGSSCVILKEAEMFPHFQGKEKHFIYLNIGNTLQLAFSSQQKVNIPFLRTSQNEVVQKRFLPALSPTPQPTPH